MGFSNKGDSDDESAGGSLSLATLGSRTIAGSRSVVGCVVFSLWTDLALTGGTISNPVGRRTGDG